MAFDVNTFKSDISKRGLIQNNKYEVIIGGLRVPNLNNVEILKELKTRCISASLPGVAIKTGDINRYGVGVTEKMPFTGAYTDISLSFLCDRDGELYNFWYTWINTIFSVNGVASGTSAGLGGRLSTPSGRAPYTAEYKDNYSAEVDINLYTNEGDKSLSYKLYKAFPVAVNDSQLSWSDTNNLLKLNVTMTFVEWKLTR